MNPWCPVNQLENLSTWLCFARSFLVYCSNCLWRNLLISCKLQIFWDYLETSWTWQDWSFCLFCMSSMEIKGQINIARVPTLIHRRASIADQDAVIQNDFQDWLLKSNCMVRFSILNFLLQMKTILGILFIISCIISL